MSTAPAIESRQNLGDAERDRRLRKGVLGAALALGGAVALVSSGAPWAYRFLLFLPFFWSANMVAMGLLGN